MERARGEVHAKGGARTSVNQTGNSRRGQMHGEKGWCLGEVGRTPYNRRDACNYEVNVHPLEDDQTVRAGKAV